MTREDAFDRLQDYLDKNLSADEVAEFERWLARDAELAQTLDAATKIETMLKTQSWLTPNPQFTQAVMEKAGIAQPRAEAAIERVMEKASAWAPLGTLVLVAAFYGKSIVMRLLALWTDLGTWLELNTGISFVKSDPLLSLGTVILLAGVVGFYFFVARRSRVTT
jgi:anti-sigma factor RsiW